MGAIFPTLTGLYAQGDAGAPEVGCRLRTDRAPSRSGPEDELGAASPTLTADEPLFRRAPGAEVRFPLLGEPLALDAQPGYLDAPLRGETQRTAASACDMRLAR